jgi:hypothetical protein
MRSSQVLSDTWQVPRAQRQKGLGALEGLEGVAPQHDLYANLEG